MILIYGIREQLEGRRTSISNAIHGCLMRVLGLPEDKRAQRFIPMDKENFIYPGGRSDAYTVIEVNMMEGRSVETKRRLIHSLFESLEREAQLSPVDVEITIQEQPKHCWGFRGMVGDEGTLNYKIDV